MAAFRARELATLEPPVVRAALALVPAVAVATMVLPTRPRLATSASC